MDEVVAKPASTDVIKEILEEIIELNDWPNES
jgi:hypothetical protein